jgi:thiol-disulfide isomerase/thioredoxin
MKKRIILLVAIGIIFSPILILQAGDSFPSDEGNCPSCPSFGIQRFEKVKASSFSLKGLEGSKVALKALKGKPIILTFWATWCSPCKEELPTLEKFAEGKKDQLGILTVAIDGDNREKVQRFVKENKINLAVLLDEKGETARSYRIRMIPTTFLIDRDGMMIGAITGQRDWSLPEAWSAIKELFDLH